jgi:hypothetical protein
MKLAEGLRILVSFSFDFGAENFSEHRLAPSLYHAKPPVSQLDFFVDATHHLK